MNLLCCKRIKMREKNLQYHSSCDLTKHSLSYSCPCCKQPKFIDFAKYKFEEKPRDFSDILDKL